MNQIYGKLALYGDKKPSQIPTFSQTRLKLLIQWHMCKCMQRHCQSPCGCCIWCSVLDWIGLDSQVEHVTAARLTTPLVLGVQRVLADGAVREGRRVPPPPPGRAERPRVRAARLQDQTLQGLQSGRTLRQRRRVLVRTCRACNKSPPGAIPPHSLNNFESRSEGDPVDGIGYHAGGCPACAKVRE